MIRLKHKRTNRIITAAGLLVLFAFASLFATYQSSKDVTSAYASSSGNNNAGIFGCIAAIAACLGAIASAIEKCLIDQNGNQCAQAIGRAMLACSQVPADCNFQMPAWPQWMVDAGLV